MNRGQVLLLRVWERSRSMPHAAVNAHNAMTIANVSAALPNALGGSVTVNQFAVS